MNRLLYSEKEIISEEHERTKRSSPKKFKVKILALLLAGWSV